jgi:hypothetical protein
MTLRILACAVLFGSAAAAASLPARYFEILNAGMERIEKQLAAQPEADLAALESRRNRHFTHTVLAAAVLYVKQHPSNPRYGDQKMLAVAERIGDMVAADNEKGLFTKRLDHHRDLYMWLDAFRLLRPHLSEQKQVRWRRELEKNLTELSEDVVARQDFPAYISPFIGTSPNHYSLWSSTLHLAGKMFGRQDWEDLGAKVLHRFAAEEQARDGYWGEHDVTGPTTGYNYLTLAAVALYYEHSKDEAALEALRRVTDFHRHYTYPDGTPVEVINDRNRYWEVSAWGHFGFSHFPAGRGYAAFLTDHLREDRFSPEFLGRLAQNALYYHEGPAEPAPQQLPAYSHRMQVPAGIRKTGPWVVCLSGLISTQAVNSQFYLDRQGHLSVFHEKTGLIITGANSKRQPELATFQETVGGQVNHLPLTSRLRMGEAQDQLALSYNTIFSELAVPKPDGGELRFTFTMTPRSRTPEAQLNLQLMLKAEEVLETGSGKKITLGGEKVELAPGDLGGWIRHRGWTLRLDPQARLTWPVFPFNPYSNGPVTSLQSAVGVLSVPVTARRDSGALRRGGQDISFALEVR